MDADFVVQMRTSSAARHSHLAQNLTLANFFAFHYVDFRKMPVPGLIAIAVIDDDTAAVAAIPACGNYDAIGSGFDRRTGGRGDIEA